MATVAVDRSACERIAALLRSVAVPEDREDLPLLAFSPPEIGNFYLFVVAICHQTSPIGRPPLQGRVQGRVRRGWDYLTARFEEAARGDRKLLTPGRWASMTAVEMEDLFREPEGESLLTQPEERASLIRNLGHRMEAQGWAFADDLFALCRGHVTTGDRNLLRLLSEFTAYRDPVKKKSLFFLSLMRNSGLWSYVDDDKLEAPVDYHEVRGHLRLGTVKVMDGALARKLMARQPVSEAADIAIRGAVSEAITVISEKGLLRSPSQLHYLFWNVFRSCCTREVPHCASCPSTCQLPDRYVETALEVNERRRCLFGAVCESAQQSDRYTEHVFETDYY